VLLAHSERAELGTEECKWNVCIGFDDASDPTDNPFSSLYLVISLAPVLEGIVLLKKNADYMEEDTE
jgi:26S proteasome regulatory subunit N1